MTNTGSGRLIAKLLLTLMSLLATCGVIEVGLRVAGYDPLGSLDHGRGLFLQPSAHPDVRYEFVPGASGMGWDTDIVINAQGFRGRTASPSPYAGYRVIVIGDSITFGNLLPVESVYPSQMQAMLDPSAAAYEVLNFGAGGYDTLQEVALLEYRGLNHHPDLVIVGYCLNDIVVASANLEYIDRVRRYRENPALSWSRFAQLVVSKVDRIRISNWMEEQNKPEVFARNYAGRIAPIGDDDRELRELMQRVPAAYPSNLYDSTMRIGRLRYAFERLAAMAARESFAVAVVAVPWLDDATEEYPHRAAHEIVQWEARRAGFDVVDVIPAFMDAGLKSLRANDNDLVHPNEKGHRILATALAEYVRRARAAGAAHGDPATR